MQSVIVYRNPLEAMMWESIMTGQFLIFMIPAIMGVVLAAVLDKPLVRRYGWQSETKGYIQYTCIAAGIIGGLLAVWYV